MPIEPHPTDPGLVVMRSHKFNLQKPWVGLTDDEAQQAFKRHNCDISKDLAGILARAIENKLKKKNT